MKAGVTALFAWFGRVVEDSSTGQPSAKRFGLILSVTVLSCVMGLLGGVVAGVVWVSSGSPQAVDLVRIASSSLEIVAGLVLTAVTTGYVAGKAVETKKGAADAANS